MTKKLLGFLLIFLIVISISSFIVAAASISAPEKVNVGDSFKFHISKVSSSGLYSLAFLFKGTGWGQYVKNVKLCTGRCYGDQSAVFKIDSSLGVGTYNIRVYDYKTGWASKTIQATTGTPDPITNSLWSKSGSNIFYNNGNVGIGTMTPGDRLHVSGNIILDSGVLSPVGGQDLRLIMKSPNNIIFSDSFGEEMMRISSSGSVGIGTIKPTEKLDVIGNIHATGDICTDAGGGKCLSKSGGSGGTNSLWTQKNSDIFYNNGNVGIGTITPSEKLEVIGKIKANNIILKSTSQLDRIQVDYTFGSTVNKKVFRVDGLGRVFLNSPNTFIGPRLIVYGNLVNVPQFVVTGDSVGIGTVIPSERLHVIGNIKAKGIKIGTALNGLPALDVDTITSSNTGSEVIINSKATFKDNVIFNSGLTANSIKVGHNTLNGLPALYVNTFPTSNTGNGFSQPSTGSEVIVNSKATFKEKVDINGLLTVHSIKLTKISGTGIAYACIDSNGFIFRSQTPCI